MSFQNIPPERLFQVLNNTGLQNKDNPLYQLLFSMIAALLRLENITGGTTPGGGGGSTITNITQIIQQIALGDGDGSGGGDLLIVPGPPGRDGRDGVMGPPGMDSGDGGGSDFDGMLIPGPIGPEGPMVPYYIGVNETFHVPLYKQALFAMNIENDGTLEIDGFLIEVDQNEASPYLQYSDSTNQTPGVTTPVKVTFNTADQSSLITYSGGDFTIERTGLYVFIACGQITESSNGKVNLDMWLVVNGVAVPNSGVRNSIASNNDNKVVALTYVLPMTVGDVFSIYISVDDASKGAGLYAFAPAGEAAIPSIMLTARKVGG